MGFPGYFLVVADFINWAKEQRHPGRARAAARAPARWPPTRWGSPTSTRSPHGLIFERFLNPERVSMPDFDVDFDERRRGEVIRYVTEKYGEDRVAQIVTYGTIKAKQALKDAVAGARLSRSRWGRSSPRRCRRPSWARTSRSPGIFDPKHTRYDEAGEFRALHDDGPRGRRGRRRPRWASRA